MEGQDLEIFLNKIANHSDEDVFLDLSGCDLNDDDIQSLIEAMEENKHIRKLDLSSNAIGNLGIGLLSRLKYLKSLNLKYNDIDASGLRDFSSEALEVLDIGGNPIGDEGVCFLLDHFKNIREVGFCECGISNPVANRILRCNRFMKVNLSTNQLDDSSVVEFLENTTLKALNLSQNKFTKEGASCLAQCSTLEALDLGSNDLGDEGAAMFANNQGLISLNLSQNFITADGFLSIIGSQTNIKDLRLFTNHIDLDAETKLTTCSDSIESLNLSYNHILDRSAEVLKKLLAIPSLHELNLSHNRITDACATVLHQYRPATLKKLNLNYNPIDNLDLITEGFKEKRQRTA